MTESRPPIRVVLLVDVTDFCVNQGRARELRMLLRDLGLKPQMGATHPDDVDGLLQSMSQAMFGVAEA